MHLGGAALGGALVGGFLGEVGTWLSIAPWRPWIILLLAGFALWHSIAHRAPRLGLRRQVPRSWSYTMPVLPRYFLWGMLLGSGLATGIYYAVFIVLLGAQFASGILLGCASGAIFGIAREAPVVLPLVRARGQPVNLGHLAGLFPRLEAAVRRLNTLWLIVGGAALMLSSMH